MSTEREWGVEEEQVDTAEQRREDTISILIEAAVDHVQRGTNNTGGERRHHSTPVVGIIEVFQHHHWLLAQKECYVQLPSMEHGIHAYQKSFSFLLLPSSSTSPPSPSPLPPPLPSSSNQLTAVEPLEKAVVLSAFDRASADVLPTGTAWEEASTEEDGWLAACVSAPPITPAALPTSCTPV